MIKRLLPYALGVLPVLIPAVVYAATTNGGLVPCGVGDSIQSATSCNACNFVQLIQNIINFIIVIAIPIAALLFAYAGFRLITAGGNPAVRTGARKIVTSTAIGFIVVLISWTVVNTIIYTLVAQNYFTNSSWFRLECVPTCTSSSPNERGCRQVEGSIAGAIVNGLTTGNGNDITNTPPANTNGGYDNTVQQCSPSNTSCSMQALEDAGMSPSDASVMSCIATTESSGNANAYNPAEGGAHGLFQITTTNWQKLFPSGPCSGIQNSYNASCNIQAAETLIQQRRANNEDPYGDWTCPNCNAKANSCIEKYSTISV